MCWRNTKNTQEMDAAIYGGAYSHGHADGQRTTASERDQMAR